MTDGLTINGLNAYATYGVMLAEGSLSALMTPAPLKGYVINESAAAHGRIVANAPAAMPKVDSRDVQLTIYLYAKSTDDFYAKYNTFVTMLQSGVVKIKTRYQNDVTYKLLYESCSQFSQFNGRLGKFVIKFNEPNPTDRDD